MNTLRLKDYNIIHLKENGFEAIMINSNPETVSTDYDTADKLYFEPLTWREVKSVLNDRSRWSNPSSYLAVSRRNHNVTVPEVQ